MFWGSATFSKVLSGVVILFMLVFFQSLLSDAVTIWEVKLDMGIIILVYVALTRGSTYGMIFGFAIGLLSDIFTPPTLGWGALVKCTIGFSLGSFKDHLYLEGFYAKGAVIFISLLLNDLFYYLLITGVFSTFSTLIGSSLPSAVYTSVVGMLIFLVMHRLHWERWSVEEISE